LNAIVDGAPARVRPVAQGLRSVAVNKGKHEIELFFRPWPYFMGATVSVLFFLAFVAWVVVVWRRKRPSVPLETPVPFWTEPA
jgi:uncharacterized membrane protein YfhO